ncbi:MAG TPA: PCYCGC motif-containing (lipo)protein [Acidimicrobiales bacterium]|nr:PCYCGC motif-containing (lipo)protein [Acidimicrobiales bacterium]
MTADEAEPVAQHRLVLYLLAPVVVALAVIAGTVAGFASEDAAHGAAPLELAAVPSEVAGHYHAARDLAEVYQEVPCYCGCEEFLAHRDLYDCFVRADGQGWEAHAAGCGVCIAESALVRDLTETGTPVDDIPAAVIDRFGTTPTTAPPT